MIIEGDNKAIAAAFIKARGEMNATVAKDAKGNFGKYVTLAAIAEATSPAFAANGLAIVQEASADEHGVCVETWLVHESGSTMRFTPLTMPLTDRKPQAVGSAITYARRYALGAICGLAPDDDDGEAAQGTQGRADTRPAPPRVQPTNGAPKPPQRPAAAPIDDSLPIATDVIFQAEESPTDEEHDIITIWQSSQDAYVWSVNVGACSNIHEAENSMRKVVREKGLKFTAENKLPIFLAFLRHQNMKLAQQPEAA